MLDCTNRRTIHIEQIPTCPNFSSLLHCQRAFIKVYQNSRIRTCFNSVSPTSLCRAMYSYSALMMLSQELSESSQEVRLKTASHLAKVIANLLAYGPGWETKNMSCPSRYFCSIKCKLSKLIPSLGSRSTAVRGNLVGVSAVGISYEMSPSFRVPTVGGWGLSSLKIWLRRR